MLMKLLVALPLLIATGAHAAGSRDVLWLSETAPGKRMKMAEKHDHGAMESSAKAADKHDHDAMDSAAKEAEKHDHDAMASGAAGEEADTIHGETKSLWLRRGNTPMKSPYVAAPGEQLRLLDLNGRRWEVPLVASTGQARAKIELKDMGFYNAYLVQEDIQDNVLQGRIAKAELLKGTCCMKDIDPTLTRAITDSTIPLELVREHLPDEKLFTRMVSGDRVAFTLLSQGKPLANVAVTMSTQQGWQKTLVSDDTGYVEFTLIRDYFPAWNDFKKRKKETFLVFAEADLPVAGEVRGLKYTSAHYTTSLAGRYLPSPYDYRSYAWGLGIGLFVTSFGGLSVYLYRRRRVKPFQEVRFDEKA